MRHLKLRGQLGLVSAHREALLRNMLLSLLKYERIRTTLVRAKQLKSYAEKIIELGKTNEWRFKRQARLRVHEKDALEKLFQVYGPRFKNRHGGYTRIFQTGFRRGDGAPMSIIEILPDPSKENEPRFIETKVPTTEEEKKKAAQRKQEGKQKKKDRKETEKTMKERLRSASEAKRAKRSEDIAHSHISQRRKTDKGTGRSKATKKGLS